MEQFIANHLLAVPVVAAGISAFFAKIDDVIVFSLRFFDAQTIKDELDRLDALAKAQVDKDAAAVKATVTHAPTPTIQP